MFGNTQTQAQIFATQYAKNIASNTLKSIAKVQKMAEWAVYGIMAVSYLHQFAYLLHIFQVGWKFETLDGIIHDLSSAAGAAIIPLIVDLFTVICIKAVSTIGLIHDAKKWGLIFLVFPVGVSGYINWQSSLTVAIAIVYVCVVALIPGGEFLKSKMLPDFELMDAIERRAVAITVPVDLEPLPVASTTISRKEQLRNAAKARETAAASPSLTPTQLAKATGVSASTAKKILDDIATAPVSPGPTGPGPAGPSTKELDEIVNTPAYL